MKSFAFFFTVLLLLTLSRITAQNILFQDVPGENTRLQLRFMHPSMDSRVDYSFFSGVFELNANIPVTSKLNISAALPLSNYAPSEWDGESGIGNLFIAAQPILKQDSSIKAVVTIGVTLPTASTDKNRANYTGLLTNFHHSHKYAPDILAIYTNIANHYFTPNGVFYGFELGPRIWIPTGSGDRDIEFMIHYGLTAGINSGGLLLNAELVGLIILSGTADSFSDRMFHTLALGAGYTGWPVQPGIFYKLYLKEELSDSVDGVLGLSLSYYFNR